ncbi:SAF domain-containing protein [Microbacterium sp. NPDC019599]|uniref:SAF domain-containing protein n=1 Tax=Microbacterium sp. NPDC019599 TaxID=3154690 RepID=UPI00340F3DDF
MTALDSARPRPRAFWGDARFFLGILLIAASIAGVWFVVSAARQSVPVFAATRTIVPGDAVAADDVRLVEVALGQVGEAYLTAEALDEGLVATRTVAEGELVPQSAVDAASTAATTTVVVHSAVEVPSSVAAGSVVEVWEAPLLEHGGYDVPRILVADATVVAVTSDDSMIGGGAASLELVIPRADVAAVLEAMADESALSVVPTAGAAR